MPLLTGEVSQTVRRCGEMRIIARTFRTPWRPQYPARARLGLPNFAPVILAFLANGKRTSGRMPFGSLNACKRDFADERHGVTTALDEVHGCGDAGTQISASDA